jgi:hypothetical protein
MMVVFPASGLRVITITGKVIGFGNFRSGESKFISRQVWGETNPSGRRSSPGFYLRFYRAARPRSFARHHASRQRPGLRWPSLHLTGISCRRSGGRTARHSGRADWQSALHPREMRARCRALDRFCVPTLQLRPTRCCIAVIRASHRESSRGLEHSGTLSRRAVPRANFP